MAAIFQIRRGSGSVSLVDGELYLHKSSGSLQFSLGDGNPILLARLDQINSGSLNLSGDVTASNAVFTGDVAISGNLYLGNQTSDNISALGQFTTNLVPNPTNTISVGTPTAIWKNMYATTFSGSLEGNVVGIGNPTTFSASVAGRLSRLQESTASLNSFTQSQDTKNLTLQTYTASIDSKILRIQESTASLNIYTGSNNTKWSTLENVTSSILSYTASLKSAIDVTGGNTRILGNLIVDGTQTSLNVNNLYIEDKLITLSSGSTTSVASDGSGFEIAGANVSMSWEHTNTRFGINTNVGVIGSISSSTIIGLNNASVGTYSTSVDSRLSNLQSTSASVNSSLTQINAFTASNGNTSLNLFTSSINSYTSSANAWSGGVDAKFTTLQTLTASMAAQVSRLQESTASLNAFTSSQILKNTTLEGVTSSLYSATSSLNSWTGSGFFTPFSTSVDARILAVSGSVAYLNQVAFGGLDLNSKFSNIELATASLQTYTSSANIRFNNLESFTASNNIASLNSYTASLKNAITVSGTDISLAGNLTVLGTTTVIDSTVVNIKDNIIQLNGAGSANAGLVVRDATGTTTSGSLLWDTTNDYWIAGPLGAESKLLRAGGDNVISSSSQINLLLPAGVVSGSSQVNFTQLSGISNGIVSSSTQVTPLLPIGTVSGSSQITLSSTTGYGTVINQNLLTTSDVTHNSITGQIRATNGVVSGSSQINFTQLGGISANIISASSDSSNVDFIQTGGSITANLYGGVVSGSIQVLGSSTIMSGSSGNYQFNSIGVGTAASAVAGEIRATNDITAYYSSDIRLKENIQPIQNALEKVESISGNTYDWKEGFEEIHSHKGNDIGVIAQEIEEILPQIVTNRDNGYKAVQYEKIVPLLIEAIKELSAKVKQLENK